MGEDKHSTDVDDVHEAVEHTPPARLTLELCSSTPKLSPVTVTEAPPLCGAFNRPYDTTGASKLSTGCPVPATAPTVTAEYPNRVLVLLVKDARRVEIEVGLALESDFISHY